MSLDVEARHPDLHVEFDGDVAIVEMRRPPSNFFDADLIAGLADTYRDLDQLPVCRAIVLAAAGKAFCAGADHRPASPATAPRPARTVMHEAIRLFQSTKPVVAAVHGAAVGGGMGLALSADFRVTCPAARFWPNFVRLGFHPGFGLTATLPRLIGEQRAAMLLLTGRKVGGEEAVRLGIADELADDENVRARGVALAHELAAGAPLAVVSTRKTLRRHLVEQLACVLKHEAVEQEWQRGTDDFREGVLAMRERRDPVFKGC